jgi:hypothetical protein
VNFALVLILLGFEFHKYLEEHRANPRHSSERLLAGGRSVVWWCRGLNSFIAIASPIQYTIHKSIECANDDDCRIQTGLTVVGIAYSGLFFLFAVVEFITVRAYFDTTAPIPEL